MTQMIGPVMAQRPRIAWDGARTIVAAIEAGYQGWLAYVLGERIDDGYHAAVLASWSRITEQPELLMSEAGLWRARLDELLIERPSIASDLVAVLREVRDTMAGFAGVRR